MVRTFADGGSPKAVADKTKESGIDPKTYDGVGDLVGWVLEDGPQGFDPNRRAVYRLGYAPGEWGQAPDPLVLSTLIEVANVDALTGRARTPFAGTLPASLFLR